MITYLDNNAPEWIEKLNITYVRYSCGERSQVCINWVIWNFLKQNITRAYLPMSIDASRPLEENALDYSNLSKTYTWLYEIGFDDFVSFWESRSTGMALNKTRLRNIIDNTKKINPGLKFGVTIYEDQLQNPSLNDVNLPPDIKTKIDYVHLYPHFRRYNPNLNYANYVETAKALFPQSKIIAGAYVYDRIDYIGCSAPWNSQRCTRDEELRYFNDTMRIQARLLKEGLVENIEFFPGYFGKEEKWSFWNRRGLCNPERRNECINNTKIMRQAVLQIISEEKR